MPGLKKFMLGGLDLKSNDLLRDPMRSSSMKNVTKTQKGDLDKRHGYELVETAAFELEESVYYKSLDQDIFIKSDGTIHKPYLATRISCSIATLFANVGLSVKNRIVSTEYLGNLYLTTSDGKSPVIKYDGGDAYLAGLPAPNVVFAGTVSTIDSPGAGYYYRFFYQFKDLNGNITFGPYVQLTSTINNANIYFSTFKTGNPYGKFYNKYMHLTTSDASTTQYTVDSTNNFLYSYSHNYSVGDILMVDMDECSQINSLSGNGRRFINLTITAITNISCTRKIQDITYSSVLLGSSGRSISIEYTSGGTAGSEVVSVVGSAISVQIQTGVSTATQVLSAINSSAAALALVSASITGTASTAQVTSSLKTLDGSGIKITFNQGQLSGVSFNILLASSIITQGLEIDGRLKVRVFRSTSESFGYTECSSVSKTVGADPLLPTAVFIPGSIVSNSSDDDFAISLTSSPFFNYVFAKFEDVYNEEQQKLRPPLCKFLDSYGDQLVYANIVGVWNQENNFTQYNNDDLIIPSDFGIADNGENHSANIQRIGETYDGSITGVSRCGDVLMVTKDNGIYSLDGVLEPGGYNLRKIPTNYIGCKSHNSILQVESGVFFHGNDGIYFSDGNSCQKMSLLIDPFFNSIDATLTKSTVNSSDRKFLFYMTDNTTHYCVVYDYEFREWFIWEDLDMSHGLYEKNSKVVYFAKAALLNKFNTGYSDAGVEISAFYKTNWEDIRNPSLDKKFKFIRIWNLTSSASSFNLKTQKNWVDTDLETLACSIAAYSSIQKGHDQKTVQAIRYVFENNTLGEGMPITAYEIDYEAIQALDKGN
jgi:hypothetical protein